MAFGTPYLIGSAGGTTTAAQVITSGTATTAGDTIIVDCGNSSAAGATITSVTDSKGNTYAAANSAVTAGEFGHIWIALNTTALAVSDTITITFSTTTGSKACMAIGVSGVATSAAVDQAPAGTHATSTAPSVTSGTLAQATEMAIGVINSQSTGGVPSGLGSFTSVGSFQSGSSPEVTVAYLATAATTAITFSGTIVSSNWCAMLITLLPASGTKSADVTATETATVTATAARGTTAAATQTATAAVTAAAGLAATAAASLAVSATITAGATTSSTKSADVSATETATVTAAASVAAAAAASLAVTATVTAGATVAGPTAATFPAAPLGLTVELLLNGTWTSVTPYVAYKKQQPQIIRGHPDESTSATPSSLSLALDNRTAIFTSNNPLSTFYPNLGRNVQLRMSIPEAASYLRLEGDSVSYASCPDSAGVSITGDTDIQLELTLDNWRAGQFLAGKWAGTANQRTWLLVINPDGSLRFSFSNGSVINAGISLPVPVPALRRQAIRVEYVAATGSASFWTAPGIAGPWTQLGATGSLGSSFPLLDSTAPVQIGHATDAASDFPTYTGMNGKIHAFRLLSGISGTAKASPDFTTQTPGATSFADAQSNTWTLAGTSEISRRKYRCHVETSAWTPASDPTGKDVWMSVVAGGLLRRIQQGTQTLGSAFRRALPSAVGLVGYWPAEDGNTTSAGATPAAPSQFSTAVPGVQPGNFTGGPPGFASDNSFLCSQSLPTINGSKWHFPLPSRAPDTANIFRFLMHVPSGGDTNNAIIARMYTAGTVGYVDLVYGTGGTLTLNGYDHSGGSLFTVGPQAFAVNGELLYVTVELQRSGGNVAYSCATLQPGASSGLGMSGTVAGTIGNASQLLINASASAVLSGTAVGHLTYQSLWETLFDFGAQLNAYQGEPAGQRFARLCAEQGIPFRTVGNVADTVLMGAQTPLSLSALLQECADADRGQIFEPRQALALGYRTRASMQNQAPAAALDWSADGLASFVQSAEDDQYTLNDVTVTRAYTTGGGAGSSAEAMLSTGALSTQAPPNGVGEYLSSVTLNLYADSQLADAAGWLLHMGTVDEPRYPVIEYDLARKDIGALLYSLPDLDLGDRLTIASTPAWLPPDGVTQLAAQITETFGEVEYRIGWCGVPELPYQTGIVGDPVYGRVDTDGSVLHSGIITTSATSIQVDTLAGTPTAVWTTAAADFPFDIRVGGERMTVTNITGAASPQTFTVVRSVNGVVKTHLAGEDVRLFFPLIISL